MTAIFYPDCQTTSPGRQFTLEARSPHNGTIPQRNGRKPSPDEFACKYREHQSEFRYRLLDNSRHAFRRLLSKDRRRVVWERWQPPGVFADQEVQRRADPKVQRSGSR
jgi:hypothetical protein